MNWYAARILCLILLVGRVSAAEMGVSGGYLVVKGGRLNVAGGLAVQDASTLKFGGSGGSVRLNVTLLHILSGGTMEGCGLARIIHERE